MKSILHFIIIALSFIPAAANSQGIQGNDAQENLYKLGGQDADIGVVRKFDNRYEGVKGSPYYHNDWLNGKVVFESGSTAENIQLKYNIYEDELLILQPKTGAVYADKNNVKSFAFLHPDLPREEWFIKYPHPKKAGSTQYFRVVFAGKVSLLEQIKIVFEKANYEGGYSNDKRFDEFKQYTTYYYSISSATPQKLKSSAGAVAKIFPEKQSQVKQFIVENLLDCRKPEDLIQIFQYYENNL